MFQILVCEDHLEDINRGYKTSIASHSRCFYTGKHFLSSYDLK